MSHSQKVLARSRRNLDTGCCIFEGAVTPGTGRPRMTINGRERDPRTWVYEDEHGVRLDPWVRMRSSCGDSRCVAPDHLSIPGDGRSPEDFTRLACPACPNAVSVLSILSKGAWCQGGSRPHPATAMRPVSNDVLHGSVPVRSAAGSLGYGEAV